MIRLRIFFSLLSTARGKLSRPGSVGTLRVWYSLADRMHMLITSDLCTIYEAIERVGCYKHCGHAKV